MPTFSTGSAYQSIAKVFTLVNVIMALLSRVGDRNSSYAHYEGFDEVVFGERYSFKVRTLSAFVVVGLRDCKQESHHADTRHN